MKISFFVNIMKTSDIKEVKINKVLELIKTGKYSNQIAKIRIEKDKEQRNKLKKSLPACTFSGTFENRSNNALKQSSGYSVLDFDNIENLKELRDNVNSDPFTFCSFISPSGDGLKVVVKIPKVGDDKTYKEYYHELQKHYNQYAETDQATKDISRLTFLSFDDELYLNNESDTFTDKFIAPEREITEPTNIPIIDQNEIANRLEVWFKKNYSTISTRNNNLHAFARQFNAFGVDRSVCENYLLRYQQVDFKEPEILSLINSAYKYSQEWNTKSFEDNEKVKLIKNQVIAGNENIKVKIEGVTDDQIQKEIEKHKSELANNEFWYYTDKGVIKLSSSRFKSYLENNNISKFYPSDNGGFLFIKKDDNFIKEFDENRIKDFALNDLLNRGNIDAFELCTDNSRTFKGEYLSFLKTSEIDIQRDTKEESYIYYNNTAVRTTKDSIDLVPYSDIKGLVWENQVINRDFVKSPQSEGEFKSFIWKISGENKERYFSFKSVIGYLLHSYQNEGKPKVIIFNDEVISDVPNGGSGKGLIHKAIGHIKRLSTINGKGFDPNKSFAYQTVGTDTQVLLFDDIDKNFKFENLFSLITEGLVIEKKGKDAIKIPFSESPKTSITTNYTVKGEGSSHLRRVFEVEMSAYFNDQHTPEREFGHLLFTDWSNEEWAKFDNYMIRCIQYYLNFGLVEYDKVNLDQRKLINDTNNDFIEFMDSRDWSEPKRWYKTELKDLFVSEYEDYKYQNWFTSTLFNKWIKKYCDVKKVHLEVGKSNGQRYTIIQSVPF